MSSRVYPLAAAVLITAALLFVGVFASYAMVTDSAGIWDMQDMHGRMMGGGGSDTSGTQATQGATQEAVQIRDYAFQPGNLEVPVGATVTWTNYDDAPHTATADDGSWDTGILNKGKSASITFDKTGDYTYYCVVHPNMKARIQVG